MIKLELTPRLAIDILRSDIVKNLQYDGIAAIIEYYNNIGEDLDFDQSLFWSFNRYSSARAALEDYNDSVVDEIIDGLKDEDSDEPVDEDEIEEKCEEWLNNHTICLRADYDEVVVYTEF